MASETSHSPIRATMKKPSTSIMLWQPPKDALALVTDTTLENTTIPRSLLRMPKLSLVDLEAEGSNDLHSIQVQADSRVGSQEWLEGFAAENGLLADDTSLYLGHEMLDSLLSSELDIDVVAKNDVLRRLLQAPFHLRPGAGFAVHRIANTLFIDGLDPSEKPVGSDVSAKLKLQLAYKRYVRELVTSASDNQLSLPPEHLTKKKKVSQPALLHRALDQLRSLPPLDSNDNDDSTVTTAPVPGQPLDDRLATLTNTIPTVAELTQWQHHKHLWTFQDMTALVQSDLAIFGDDQHPAISVRLQDQSQPINVLTGLDVWLDNLMCNVPEVLMCYHLDGIIQNYTALQVDELPQEFQFDPQAVCGISNSIISFLKDSCTHEGHTYWLMQGEGEDCVRLFDLTSLAQQDASVDGNPPANPFSHSVALLLYRIASRMMQSADEEFDADTVRRLLSNASQLIESDRYPHLAGALHFLMTGVDAVQAQQQQQQQARADTGDKGVKTDTTFPRSTEAASAPSSSTAIPMPASLEHQLDLSLSYLVEGLTFLCNHQSDPRCFDLIPAMLSRAATLFSKRLELSCVDQHFGLALRAGHMALCCAQAVHAINSQHVISTSPQLDAQDPRTWQVTLPGRVGLAVHQDADVRVRVLQRLADGLTQAAGLDEDDRRAIVKQAHERDVDEALVMLACRPKEEELTSERAVTWLSAWQGWLEQPKASEDTYDIDFKDGAYPASMLSDLPLPLASSRTELVNAAVQLYQQAALESQGDAQAQVDLQRRVGNVLNVGGASIMADMTLQLQGEDGDATLPDDAAWQQASLLFLKASKQFEQANDVINLALVHCNQAKLMRIGYARLVAARKDTPARLSSARERQFHDQAVKYYQSAMTVLGIRKVQPDIYDMIQLELGGASLAFAMLLQDDASIPAEGVEREVAELLSTAIKMFQGELSTLSKVAMEEDKFRARKLAALRKMADCHHRLGLLHGHVVRQGRDNPSKHALKLCRKHFNKALGFYAQVSHQDKQMQGLQLRLELASVLVGQGTKGAEDALGLLLGVSMLDTNGLTQQEETIGLLSEVHRLLCFGFKRLLKDASGKRQKLLKTAFARAIRVRTSPVASCLKQLSAVKTVLEGGGLSFRCLHV
eukprot:m.131437 g.131437  ORF g.131437 m.131437 type:complete len:1130 (+) comp15911_c0_seq1:45-3434(+)